MNGKTQRNDGYLSYQRSGFSVVLISSTHLALYLIVIEEVWKSLIYTQQKLHLWNHELVFLSETIPHLFIHVYIVITLCDMEPSLVKFV